jgi:hypothetical protein
MEKRVRIIPSEIEVETSLNETGIANRVWGNLPITSMVNTWGDEIYLSTPVEAELEEAKELVELGDIAYWPQGKAICIFFGKTPISKGDEIKPITLIHYLTSVYLCATLEGGKRPQALTEGK